MQRNVSIMSNVGLARVAVFVFVLTVAQSRSGQIGATYFVSKGGSDRNPGTIGSPWLTIQHAANSVSAGATVYVLRGLYYESVNFRRSGTAFARITFRSYPGETAVIDG